MVSRISKFYLPLLSISLGCIVCVAEETSQLTESKVRAMMAEVSPHIEEVTGRKFKAELNCRFVDRPFARDVLKDEMGPQMKKFLKEMPEEKVNMAIENAAHKISMISLGKYSCVKKEFYIISENLHLHIKRLKIKDEDFDNFLLMMIAHEMVHALDDQYFDIGKKISQVDNVEEASAFNALVEGHAVYTTKKIAERLNISEIAQKLSLKSAAGVLSPQDRMQQEMLHSVYEKGSEFVAFLVQVGGSEAITKAFEDPPISTRQIFHPEEYLSPGAMVEIDYPELFAAIPKHLPTESMEKNFVPLGEMTLRSLFTAHGVSEKETNLIAAGYHDGALQEYADATGERVYRILVLIFKNRESIDRFCNINEKIQESTIKQINARLNASCKLKIDEELPVMRFDKVYYKELERIIDQKVRNKTEIDAYKDTLYVEIVLEKPKISIKKESLILLLEDILNAYEKQRIEKGTKNIRNS